MIHVSPGRIARLILDRPERGNALSAAMLTQLGDGLGELAGDGDARCIVLSGRGKHFCAGADVEDIGGSAASGVQYGAGFEALLRRIEEHPLPVIASVHGAALGAGCQLLAACDLAVATHDATIAVPSAKLGLILDLEKVQRMVRVVGLPHARELLLAGRAISGREAAAWGLVARSVDPGDLDAETATLAETVAGGAPLSVRGSKAALRTVADHAALSRDAHAEIFAGHDADAAAALDSEDLAEGIRALAERRSPEFRGK